MQQPIDPIDRMLGDTLDEMAQTRLRVEAVELGRADQAVDGRSALAARVEPGEHEILAARRLGQRRTL